MNIELVDKALEVVSDEPLLINLVSKRVQQLNNGRSPLITVVERMGTADIALTEIIEGKIVIDEGQSTD
jgi:DNA-directed RNA polymerase subunit omega